MHMHIAERINSLCPSWHGTFRVTYKCSASSVAYDMIGGHDQNTHSCGSSIPGTPCRVQSCGKSGILRDTVTSSCLHKKAMKQSLSRAWSCTRITSHAMQYVYSFKPVEAVSNYIHIYYEARNWKAVGQVSPACLRFNTLYPHCVSSIAKNRDHPILRVCACGGTGVKATEGHVAFHDCTLA